jgi:hypothetical protein
MTRALIVQNPERVESAATLLERLGKKLPDPEPLAKREAPWQPVDVPVAHAAERLRLELAEARRTGLPFDLVWKAASARALALYSTNRREHEAWTAALTETREAWRAAYEGDTDPARWARAMAGGVGE